MAYKVGAKTGLGGAVSVIVDTTADAWRQVTEYREAGFSEVYVKDLDGREIAIGSDADRLSQSDEE